MNKISGTFPVSLGFAGSRLDRISERRNDAALIAEASAHPNAGYYVVAGENILLAKRGDALDAMLSAKEAEALGEPLQTVFLGLDGDAARSGISIPIELAERAKAGGGYAIIDLRSIAVQGLANEHLASLAAAKSLLVWHARHRFCANCGHETKSVEAGWRRDCPNCGTHHFPRTDPCVIMLVIDGERCLLGRSPRFLPNMWSCLAGFVEPAESFEEAVRRETFEESGIEVGRMLYFASQPWPFPMSAMVGFHAEAKSTELKIDWNELDGARWFGRDEAKLMLEGKHPEGLFTPPPVGIAYHLIRAFVEKGSSILEG